jgi:competence ComEA-like helix-hairpin-helix protein
MKCKNIWLTCALGAILLTLPCGAQTELPDGPGKSSVEKLCSNCHGLAAIVGLRRTKVGWQTSVDDMAARGAAGTDEEFDTVVEYLARYLGKVNVNIASSKELQEVVDISAKEADAIVKYRTANGAFKDLDALEKVPDVDMKKLAERKDRIAFK